jgi:hypothetical protein
MRVQFVDSKHCYESEVDDRADDKHKPQCAGEAGRHLI